MTFQNGIFGEAWERIIEIGIISVSMSLYWSLYVTLTTSLIHSTLVFLDRVWLRVMILIG